MDFQLFWTFNAAASSGNEWIIRDTLVSKHGKFELGFIRPGASDKLLIVNVCGAFGICDISASPLCECLQGYEPKFKLDWDIDDYSGGCVRKTPPQCGSNNEGFVHIQNVELPASSESMQVGNDQICEYICLSNCSCNAYAYSSGGECLLWNDDLIDLKRLPNNSRQVEFNIKLFESSNRD
ncbi:G-type lectin S-receptor-like serine/threonine-protein kinase At2g19130 [Lycium barbarum]|uniref:G-type lectin S-receptor-like serine/threonine-protein kinase At2g19130 n=1 Tax=Lycium barbarum TaxID=112863 RepID=UPI00293E7616|nr:G-type lectin S-receptor-like serine/threonine-protein kinase At2g19130 [Lycium barbarum]